MKSIEAIIDSHIRIDVRDLPPHALSHLADVLSIPNKGKEEARKQHQWGWQNLPDEIPMYEIVGDTFIMPRGFLEDFVDGMKRLDYAVDLDDQRRWKALPAIGDKPKLRPWQEKAMPELLDREQGMWKAPAGSGKTVGILGMIHALGCKSLVIVNTKDILWQWQERARQFLGDDYPIGQIGDNIFEVSQYLTIATAQTLHSRYDQLEAQGFFDVFSFVCLDECHHATAETYNRIMDRFSARYRFGVSATPDKTGDFALAQLVIGPIVHTTKPKDVSTLMKPKVVRVPTDFRFAFRGTQNRWQRSNYPQLIQALIRDADRNALICQMVWENQGHHQLLLSKRLEHLGTIHDMLVGAGFPDPIVTITGQDDNGHRQEAKALAEISPCVILSTLADEAMDIPRLDRLHLAYPQKNPGLTTQQVGRVERVHPDKKDALIYDYYDGKVGPLDKQWRTRRLEVYLPRGYEIELVQMKPA